MHLEVVSPTWGKLREWALRHVLEFGLLRDGDVLAIFLHQLPPQLPMEWSMAVCVDFHAVFVFMPFCKIITKKTESRVIEVTR